VLRVSPLFYGISLNEKQYTVYLLGSKEEFVSKGTKPFFKVNLSTFGPNQTLLDCN